MEAKLVELPAFFTCERFFRFKRLKLIKQQRNSREAALPTKSFHRAFTETRQNQA
jgi:hypothetical protein